MAMSMPRRLPTDELEEMHETAEQQRRYLDGRIRRGQGWLVATAADRVAWV